MEASIAVLEGWLRSQIVAVWNCHFLQNLIPICYSFEMVTWSMVRPVIEMLPYIMMLPPQKLLLD